MAKLAPITFTGASNVKYEFTAYSIDTKFKSIGGIYFFTKRYRKNDGRYYHDSIYIGQTEDLSSRFNDHHKAEKINAHEANCICIYPEENEARRIQIEADLIESYNPSCND